MHLAAFSHCPPSVKNGIGNGTPEFQRLKRHRLHVQTGFKLSPWPYQAYLIIFFGETHGPEENTPVIVPYARPRAEVGAGGQSEK
jgi:hypothetical protein